MASSASQGDTMSVERCNPAEMRKNMIAADAFKRCGIDFVPIPVRSPEHKAELLAQCFRELDAIEEDTPE